MRILFTLAISLLVGNLIAQKLHHVPGHIIVQASNQKELKETLVHHGTAHRSPITIGKTLSKRLGIYLVTFDHGRIHDRNLLKDLKADRTIQTAQFDHVTEYRGEPNDTRFASQWQWVNAGQTGGLIDADTDADLAWDISHGGVTPLGDTIVVAIIDDGIGYNHEDITANTWVNHAEVPNNGFDDDENGYIDDVFGWNVYDNTPDVLSEGHGLSVAGMIGAVGNNGTGISGINWNVKMMAIVGGTPESAAIASYAYAMEQRILYHESNGERGAFVVATNSSWGIDFGQPSEAPLWCAFYDSLGAYGIISAAATSNQEYDVDEFGDLPTGCTSEFLLSVTALNHNNDRTFSAYGLEQVDFGAPGEDIFTTEPGNSYGTGSGTSFASPVAAGLVALLYSAPCLSVAELAHTDPQAAARYVRDIIFSGVQPDEDLAGETKFGGSLNAGNSMSILLSLCSECPIPFGLTTDVISDTDVLISWSTTDTVDAVNIRYRPVSAIDWDTITDITQPFLLTDLNGCTTYEFQLESICADTSTGFQSISTFTTDGCCELPADIQVISNNNSFQASWSEVLAAEFFLIQWRPQGDPEWMEEVTSLNMVTIGNLLPCSFYEFRLQTDCDTAETGFSNIITFRTRNCGNCLDLPYCESFGQTSDGDYIDSLVIGNLINHSGDDGGYLLVEDSGASYLAGEEYPVMLRPGFGFFGSFDEQFRIWLDINQDGVFDDEEMLLDTILFVNQPNIMDSIRIPSTALNGETRMRVSMAFVDSPFGVDQGPCEILQFGEVEDYCVTIIRDNNTCPRVDTVFFDGITFTSAVMYWPAAEGAIAYTYRYRELGSIEPYSEMADVDTLVILNGLTKCTTYEVQVRTVCLQDTTSYDSTYFLETECDVATHNIEEAFDNILVYPNPTSDVASVSFAARNSGDLVVTVFDAGGKPVLSKKLFGEKGIKTTIQLDQLSDLSPGLYFISLDSGSGRAIRKLVKL